MVYFPRTTPVKDECQWHWQFNNHLITICDHGYDCHACSGAKELGLMDQQTSIRLYKVIQEHM